jgi:thiamine transporter
MKTEPNTEAKTDATLSTETEAKTDTVPAAQTSAITPVSSAVRMLTESALMLAVATVLGLLPIYSFPNGGSITIGSMIPIILISIKYPFYWSLAVAMVYSAIQMMTGFYAPPTETLLSYIAVVLLDYVFAFGVLALAGLLYKALYAIKVMQRRLCAAMVACFLLRFAFHYTSGLIIWGSYAPEGQPVWLYSLVYNGPYMLGEIFISGFIVLLTADILLPVFLERRVLRKSHSV